MSYKVYYNNSHQFWRINGHVIDENLPGMFILEPFRAINLSMLARKLSEYLPDRIYYKSASSVLRALFNILRRPDAKHGEVVPWLFDLLDDLLRKDSYGFHRGMPKSRSYFITLALLAQLTNSFTIANCLIDFFLEQHRVIVMDEHAGYLSDWAGAIDSLRGLVPHGKIHSALGYLGIDRGRRRLRIVPGPRSRTMPPLLYPRLTSPHPGYLPLPAPNMASHGYPSPSPSMNYALEPYRDSQVDAMQMEQDVLWQRVEDLELNQQHIGMEMDMAMGQNMPLLLE